MVGRFIWHAHWVVALSLLLLGFAGCNDNDMTPEPTQFSATLMGAQEVPPVNTPATGTGTVTINPSRTAITVRLQSSGFPTTVTAAHIHAGAIGVNGPVIFTLFMADGAFPDDLMLTLTAANLEPRPEVGITTFAEALQAIEAGATYFNIHTEANPAGEIRGQLLP